MSGRDERSRLSGIERGRACAAIGLALVLAACGGGPSGSPTVAPTVDPAGTPTATTAATQPAATPTSKPLPTAVPTAAATNGAMPAGALGQFAFNHVVASTDVEPDIWLATVWPTARSDGFTITSVRLTNDPGAELALAWSPDGMRLAFIRSVGVTDTLWTVNADGTGQGQIATHADTGSRPSWSPDGRRIAFVQADDNGPDIAVVNADATGVVRLTDDWLAESAAWSPTADLIAFRRSFSKGLDEPGTTSIWLMRPDGSEMRALTEGDEAVRQPLAWSPDGSRIAFGRDRSTPEGLLRASLHAIHVDGSTEITLTDGSTADHSPAWAPSGAHVLFVRTFDVGPEQATADLWVVNADGTGAHRLLVSDTTDFGATWSPDGNLVACMAESGPVGGGIAVLAADGTRMTIVDKDAADPVWRPGT